MKHPPAALPPLAGLARPAAGAVRARLAALVLLCVVCAQALGLMHGIVHGHPASAAPPAAWATGGAHADDAAQAPGKLEALFSSHGSEGDCRLFDALGQQHGPALCASAPAPTLAPCVSLQRHLTRACVARRAALFEARGPPAFH